MSAIANPRVLPDSRLCGGTALEGQPVAQRDQDGYSPDVGRARSADVTIELLADRMDLLVPLARIRWNEWGDEPGREDLQWWIDVTRGESGRGPVPATFVVIDAAGEAVGGVGLVPVEHPELADRGPWVVGTIVRADRRGAGIGAALMARLSLWATDASIDRLWVATGGRAVDFYRACGFAVAEVVRLTNGDRPTILSARPATRPSG
jgi:GNAT superfamily N-acetyltransferase